mmetsp:Transcript_32824/g.79878  ORF Transcript_32824/g.79878 Transcript_32824/m.79878 type:complete len:221 (+) Transcript_32824:39-701(+)
MARVAFVLLPTLAAIVAALLAYGPLTATSQGADIVVISTSEGVEKHLQPFKQQIGDDYEGYRGHIYRVLTFTNHLLGGNDTHRAAIEAALVYHDIGLWTHSMLGYLEPSVEVAMEKCTGFSDWDRKLIKDIIMWHHKITPFSDEHEDEDYTAIVDAVRKADWIDATMGVVTKGISRANIKKTQETIAEAGFHNTLATFVPRIRGWNVFLGTYELSSIMRI